MPAAPELAVRVEVPEPLIVPVLKATERPADGAVVNVTVPGNPFNAVIVMVEVPEMPVLRARFDGLAETMKSTTVNVAVVLWIMPPLVPVTVRVYVDAVEELHDTVAVPDPSKLMGEIVLQLRPLGTVSDNAIVPVNPFTDVRVIVEVVDCPAMTGAGVLAVMVKSGCTGWLNLNVAVAECTSEPLFPIIVRL